MKSGYGRAVAGLLLLPAAIGCSTSKYHERISSLERDNQMLSQQNQELQSEKRALQGQLMQRVQEAPMSAPASMPARADARVEELRAKGFTVDQVDGRTVVKLESGVLFDSGSSTLTKEGKLKLGKLGETLKAEYGSARFRIEGHTDNQPIKRSKFRSNWDLSAERSVSVLEYLTKDAGLSEAKFEVVGYADSCPVADNATEAGRKKNRRVEIVIVE